MSNLPLKFIQLALLSSSLSLIACSTPIPVQPQKQADCSCPSPAAPSPEEKPSAPTQNIAKALPVWVKSDFQQMKGWGNVNPDSLLKAFSAQCTAAVTKRKATPTGLLEACSKITAQMAISPPSKAWLEANFDAWQFQQEDGTKKGLLTGYFEPELKGSRTKKWPYIAPLYNVPNDLITVKLDDLYPELKGKRIRGRLQGSSLVPFFDRAEWEKIGPTRETPIVWINDKLDAFLLQVQGSGRVQLNDGTTIRLSYADQNGYPYKSIGKALVQRGELSTEQATMQGIRKWATQNPKKLDALLNENPSLVFFKENKVLNPSDGPIGALGIPIAANLSLAVDQSIVPYGSLLWMASTSPETQAPFQQGMLAQDTGGAIRGRVRADYFWGTGKKAGELAGITRQPLELWLIWPKNAPLPESQLQ